MAVERRRNRFKNGCREGRRGSSMVVEKEEQIIAWLGYIEKEEQVLAWLSREGGTGSSMFVERKRNRV
jgi:hypothetical protein